MGTPKEELQREKKPSGRAGFLEDLPSSQSSSKGLLIEPPSGGHQPLKKLPIAPGEKRGGGRSRSGEGKISGSLEGFCILPPQKEILPRRKGILHPLQSTCRERLEGVPSRCTGGSRKGKGEEK